MKLSTLLAGLPHLRRRVPAAEQAADPDILDITFDSRAVRPGTLFVALVGASSDGHRYVQAAVDRGASAVLVNDEYAGDPGVPVVETDDTRVRLGALASRFYDNPSAHLGVIGITGTNGKTTITFLLEAALQAAGREPGILGTVNYRWRDVVEPAPNTTPESLVVHRLLARMADDGADCVAMEVSSHGLATHRVESVLFDVAVFTNLSQDHLDFHPSMQAYRDAKASLFIEHLARAKAAGKSPVAVLNVDDEEGRRLSRLELPGRSVTYSASGSAADWRATSWAQALGGTTMALETPTGPMRLQTRLLGAFNVSNVLATLAACHALGVEPETAAAALRNLRGVPGRLQHLGGGAAPDVFVDYAHTPDAIARALEALRPLAPARLVVVFGCGGDRDRAKRPQMGAAAAAGADFVVLTSDNPRTEQPGAIIDDIRPAMPGDPSTFDQAKGWTVVVDRREAILRTIRSAAPSDVILIAGKGHENYQEVSGERRPFDDVAIAREALT